MERWQSKKITLKRYEQRMCVCGLECKEDNLYNWLRKLAEQLLKREHSKQCEAPIGRVYSINIWVILILTKLVLLQVVHTV